MGWRCIRIIEGKDNAEYGVWSAECVFTELEGADGNIQHSTPKEMQSQGLAELDPPMPIAKGYRSSLLGYKKMKSGRGLPQSKTLTRWWISLARIRLVSHERFSISLKRFA
jgi:hypothetical protein